MAGSYVADVHPIMTGPDELRRTLETFLLSELNPIIDAARVRLGIQDYELPYPKQVAVDDPYATSTNMYPVIGFIINHDNEHTRTDNSDSMESEYWIRYSCRFVVVCISPQDDEEKFLQPPRTQAMRLMQRLTACLKALLLDQPTLGDKENLELIESTMTTDYLEAFLMKTQSERYVSQSIINVDIKFRQWTYNPPYGTPGLNNRVVADIERLS